MNRVSDPASKKHGPVGPDHRCDDYLLRKEIEIEGIRAYVRFTCGYEKECPTEVVHKYRAPISEFGRCPMYDNGHIDEMVIELTGYTKKESLSASLQCDCGICYMVEYGYEEKETSH